MRNIFFFLWVHGFVCEWQSCCMFGDNSAIKVQRIKVIQYFLYINQVHTEKTAMFLIYKELYVYMIKVQELDFHVCALIINIILLHVKS